MSKPTPGPWEWVFSDKECKRPIALVSRTIEMDVLCASEDAIGPRAYAAAEDARLIAAAPDLLEQLRVAVCYVPDRDPSKAAMLAAIAKAKGGAE